MTLVWLGILALSFYWLRELPLYYELGGSTRWLLIGVGLLIVGFRNKDFWHGNTPRSLAVLVLAGAVLGAAWLGGPFRVGFVILGLAAVLSLLPSPRDILRWSLPGLWVSSMICLVQAACIPLLCVFSSRYHQTAELPFLHDWLPGYLSFPWLAWLLYVPLKILNSGTSLIGSTLYLQTLVDTQPLTPTWEKLGLIPLSLFVVGAMLVLLLRSDWRKRLLGLFVWITVFAYVRLFLLFLLVNQFRNEQMFWRFNLLFFSFLLLPFLLSGWWHLGGLREPLSKATAGAGPTRHQGILGRLFNWLRNTDSGHPTFSHKTRWPRVSAGAVLLVGGLTVFWGFHDPGTPKPGRVLIDEGHSDWEWTTQPFDTTWYGGKSGYNYYCLADFWDYFYDVETRRDSLTGDLLADWDVLVIKTPTKLFAVDEIDAIEDFVRGGGGLFLIGDHTNVFGTSTYLNPIAERFGMYFRYDATYDLATMGLSLFERPRRFAHPIVRFMPNYLFATSCTLYSPPLSENVILGYGLRAMYLDYSETSYFPVKQDKMNYDFGLFVQAGGVKCGKGRVLGYTDSTCFSNFFMFMPGKPELALASIEWLNRTNRWSWISRLFLLVSLGGLVWLFIEARRNSGLPFLSIAVASGALALVVLGVLTERSVATSYALPEPDRAPTYVTFDHSHGNYLLPTESLPVSNWQNFQTFFVWTQRLGLMPRDESSVAKAVDNSSVLVEVQPVRPFTIEEIDLIVDFVRRGGTLVVLESPENATSTARQLMGPFMLAFDEEVADSVAVLNVEGDTLGVARKAYGLNDVAPLLVLEDGRTTMGHRPFGKGHIVVCGASYLFCVESMGNTAVVPNDYQKRIYRAQYDLFEKVARVRVEDRYQMRQSPGEATPAR
ncbi:MAG: hypothetical protein JSW58_05605 [Candidatus Latescibacterota bacterium]|nr:MAG: hypothetical protein JSW58_05605 [Candidatus Latescibacterota bacterium]